MVKSVMGRIRESVRPIYHLYGTVLPTDSKILCVLVLKMNFQIFGFSIWLNYSHEVFSSLSVSESLLTQKLIVDVLT